MIFAKEKFASIFESICTKKIATNKHNREKLSRLVWVSHTCATRARTHTRKYLSSAQSKHNLKEHITPSAEFGWLTCPAGLNGHQSAPPSGLRPRPRAEAPPPGPSGPTFRAKFAQRKHLSKESVTVSGGRSARAEASAPRRSPTPTPHRRPRRAPLAAARRKKFLCKTSGPRARHSPPKWRNFAQLRREVAPPPPSTQLLAVAATALLTRTRRFARTKNTLKIQPLTNKKNN